jgi:hypothetical protein
MKSKTITHTEYAIRIVTPESTPELNLRLGHQFTPTINKAIGTDIERAAKKALVRYVGSGKLDKCFRVGE